MTDTIEIWTDGACSGNPGPGGWGSVLMYNGHRRELSGGDKSTTNNRMEMMAVIRALDALKRSCRIIIHTDSTYVMKGMTEWMENWKRRGWKTANRKPVKNQDLWEELDAATARHCVRWHWVEGHAGHEGNERADALANRGVDEIG